MNSKIVEENQNEISPLKKQKPRAKAIVCRSAFRRRHARLPALFGCILNFRRN